METEKHKTTGIGEIAFQHAAGTVILGSALAGIGAAVALAKGRPVKSEATVYGILGTVSGLGFGRTIYQGLFGNMSKGSSTWQQRVSAEKTSSHAQRSV
jgi:hypothetical protein